MKIHPSFGKATKEDIELMKNAPYGKSKIIKNAVNSKLSKSKTKKG